MRWVFDPEAALKIGVPAFITMLVFAGGVVVHRRTEDRRRRREDAPQYRITECVVESDGRLYLDATNAGALVDCDDLLVEPHGYQISSWHTEGERGERLIARVVPPAPGPVACRLILHVHDRSRAVRLFAFDIDTSRARKQFYELPEPRT